MKKNKKNSRQPQTPLAESLEKRLALYALAAGAAGVVGVGALAFPPPAEASIVTNNNQISIGINSVTHLSVNGIDVLNFTDSFSSLEGTLKAHAGSSKGGFINKPLSSGASIGPSLSFVNSGVLASNHGHSTSLSNVFGPWANKSGYLGFKFFNSKGSKSYFGWAHLKVTANSTKGETGSISEFAYESCADQAITAGQTSSAPCSAPPPPVPEPPTLALLSLGAVGLFALRRKKLAATDRESAAKG